MQQSIAKNAVFNILYKALNVFFPFISASYVSHILLSSGVGKVAYAQNIAQYFVLLAPLGLKTYGVKQIAKNRNDKYKRNKKFSELFLINFVSTTIFSLIYYIIIFNISYFEENRLLFCVAGLAIVFNYINIDWFYEGIEQYAYIAIRSFIIKLVSLIMLFIFVKSPSDYVIYALIYVLAIGGNYIFNIIRLKTYDVKLIFSELNILMHLKSVFILLLNAMVLDLFALFDTSMLGYICDDSVVGYYSNAMKLVKVVVSLITAISGVLLPRLSYNLENNYNYECKTLVKKVFTYMLYIIIPSIVGLNLLSDSIIVFVFGKSFLPASNTLKLASILILVLAVSYFFGTQILITFNCEWKVFICSFIGMITNLTLNFILIPKMYQDGAVIASVASETISAICIYIFARRYTGNIIDFKVFMYIIPSVIIMASYINIIKFLSLSTSLEVCFSIFGGGIIYVLILLVFDKNIRGDFIKLIMKLKKKRKI